MASTDSAPPVRARNARGEGDRLREQLLVAAVTLIEDEGDAGRVSVRAIAKAAGVSPTALYLHFPDPWWKKRHEKRLVAGAPLLDGIARLLVDGGELFAQTDVEERAAQYAELFTAHPALEPAGDVVGSARLAENPYGARSPREHRAIADGLPVHRLRFRRRPRA